MYNIFLPNGLSKAGLDEFPGPDYQVVTKIDEADVIIVRSANLHGLEIPLSVKAVGRAGVGVDNIPIDSLSQRGIPVFNTPGANANAVKELVIGCLVMAARQIGDAWNFVREIDTSDENVVKIVEAEKKRFRGFELQDGVLGVIGLGTIGREVANAAQLLGMKVVGFDPKVTVESAWQLSPKIIRTKSLEELILQSDFITLHVPLLQSTQNLINSKILELTKSDVVILNFSREGIVDDTAMVLALNAGKVFSYICDFPNNLLKDHERVVMLPHLGASTEEAEDKCAIIIGRQVRDFLEDGNVVNSINFPDIALPRLSNYRLVLTNRNVPNMIGQVSKALGQAGINIHDLVNMSKGELAYTIIDLDNPVTEELRQQIASIDGVLMVRVIAPPK